MADPKIDSFMTSALAAIREEGVRPETLEKVLLMLMTLAGERALWSGQVFPDPEPEERQARYLVSTDDETGSTLYLNVMRPGKVIPPHNHTTWACIAAVEGSEHNRIYERTDGGLGPGPATLRVTTDVELKPGTGVALMPNDIHSVEIRGRNIIRHLHFYGRALETLSERIAFDLESGTAHVMDVGVKTRSN